MRMEMITEIESVKRRVDSVRKGNALVFPIFSDLHTDGLNTHESKNLLDALTVIADTLHPNAVIDLGDNLSMLGRKHHISNQQVIQTLTELFDAFHQAARCPLFLINGNHDAVGTDFFKPHLWNQTVRGKYDGAMACYQGDSSYFYVDYEDANLRMVFLSVPHDSDLAAENPTPLWAFGTEQIKWLNNVAINTDHKVLLFSHVPFYYQYRGEKTKIYEVWDGEKTAKSYVDALCGWIDDVEEAAAIVAQRKNVIACFSGHTHADSFWQPLECRGEDVNYLSCPQVVTTHAAHHADTNPTCVAIDILVLNPNEREMHIIRFGEGQDRKVSW